MMWFEQRRVLVYILIDDNPMYSLRKNIRSEVEKNFSYIFRTWQDELYDLVFQSCVYILRNLCTMTGNQLQKCQWNFLIAI